MRRTGTPHAVVPLRDSYSRRHAKEQSTTRINVMIFEVDALQPRIVPRYSFGFDECFQQPFLCNPINPANKRLAIMRHCFKNESPVFQQPIGFRTAIVQVLLCYLVEFPLHVERADAFAVLKTYNPSL